MAKSLLSGRRYVLIPTVQRSMRRSRSGHWCGDLTSRRSTEVGLRNARSCSISRPCPPCRKPIERPLSKDVSPLACDPLLSEDPLRRARGFRGNRWRVDRFQVSIGQKVMANSVLWDGSRSKGLKERFGTKPSV